MDRERILLGFSADQSHARGALSFVSYYQLSKILTKLLGDQTHHEGEHTHFDQ